MSDKTHVWDVVEQLVLKVAAQATEIRELRARITMLEDKGLPPEANGPFFVEPDGQ